MDIGPYSLADLQRLVLPVPVPDSPAPCTFQFPTVHHRASSVRPSLLLVTTRSSAARLINSGPDYLVLVLIVRPGSVGFGEAGRTLFSDYLEQRDLQQLVGQLISERTLEWLGVTADALTPSLLATWEAKYGASEQRTLTGAAPLLITSQPSQGG